MKDINEFYIYYEQNLFPIVAENGHKRKIFRRINILISLIILFIGLWFSYGLHTIVPFLLALVASMIIYFKEQKIVYPDYRTRMVSSIVRFIDKSFTYRPNDSFAKNDLTASNLYSHSLDKCEMSDVISGKVGAVRMQLAFVRGKKYIYSTIAAFIGIWFVIFLLFIISELVFPLFPNFKILNHDVTPLNIMVVSTLIFEFSLFMCFVPIMGKRWSVKLKSVFEGIIMSMDFNKNFNGITIGLSKASIDSSLTILAKPKIPEGASLVELENSDFMSEFLIYSTSQREARYLLTPAFMESLYKLKTNLNLPMNFSFSGSRLYITLAQDNFLGIDLFDTNDNFGKAAQFYKLISETFATLKELELDTRIWTKF